MEEGEKGKKREGCVSHQLSKVQKRHPEKEPLLQGCISCGTCSYPELTEDHVLTSAYVKIFRIVTRNAANKSF